jgi:phosphoglycerate dehydrogenase-like enzyme
MEEIFHPDDRERLYEMAEVVWGKNEQMPLEEFRSAVPEAQAVICSEWRYGNETLDQAQKLRGILSVSGAFPSDLDYGKCYDRRIRVLSCAPAFARQVAEMSLAMALAACRNLAWSDRAFRRGEEKYLWAGNQNTFMLYGKTVGIIGYGNLARELRPLLEPFGCRYLVYDPWLAGGYLSRLGVEPVGLEELLSKSAVIFVLAVPSAENEALLSRSMLERIQRGSVLVLMSRARVVDFEALTELVLAGRFSLATDVFPYEPVEKDHPIRMAENAVLTPHIAGSVPEGLWEIGQMAVDDLEAILKGLPPRRMQNAEPELAQRYVPGYVSKKKE